MLIVLSPAKTLDLESPLKTRLHTQPEMLDEAAKLVKVLRPKSPASLSRLMSISDKLGALNASRYDDWTLPFNEANARPAVLTFAGDVYDGLDAGSLSESRLKWAQDHVRILSGLYGLLRPLDLMQPYRLEMGTRLKNTRGPNLYAFWGKRITNRLNETLANQKSPVLINLASDEYSKSIDRKALAADIVQPVFEEPRPGKDKPWAVISFMAKKARGAMARYVIEKRLTRVESLKEFDRDGYRYSPEASTDTRWVFRRVE
ncbi:MAG: peroxide stress protein YaaA [Burkholderiaceae bacterium]